MAKKTWIPPSFKNQLHCGIVTGPGWIGPQLSRQNQKPHGKTKNLTAKTKYLTAKPKTSRQKQKPHGKNKIPHGKNKIPQDKTKTLTAKPKTSRQNQILHSKNQIPNGKSKYPRQNQRYFAFVVKYWFCREVFGFAVRFLVLP